MFDNVVVQPRDAREASDVFYRQKVGDVLLTYENEVVLTNQVSTVQILMEALVNMPRSKTFLLCAFVVDTVCSMPASLHAWLRQLLC